MTMDTPVFSHHTLLTGDPRVKRALILDIRYAAARLEGHELSEAQHALRQALGLPRVAGAIPEIVLFDTHGDYSCCSREPIPAMLRNIEAAVESDGLVVRLLSLDALLAAMTPEQLQEFKEKVAAQRLFGELGFGDPIQD